MAYHMSDICSLRSQPHSAFHNGAGPTAAPLVSLQHGFTLIKHVLCDLVISYCYVCIAFLCLQFLTLWKKKKKNRVYMHALKRYTNLPHLPLWHRSSVG